MAFATYLDNGLVGSTASYNDSKYIILSHPLAANALAIAEFGIEGYRSSLGGFLATDGRTLAGLIRVTGGGYLPKEVWEISQCTIKELQKDVFEALIAYQNVSKVPCSLLDYHTKYQYIPGYNNAPTWLGSTETNEQGFTVGYSAWNVFIDVDRGYKNDLGYGRYNLIFQASQA